MPTALAFSNGVLPPELDSQVQALLRAEWPAVFSADETRTTNGALTDRTLLVLIEGETVLSYLAIPSTHIDLAGETYRASGLSAVITNPPFRHQGHGRRLVRKARDLIAAGDADIGIFTCAPSLVDFYLFSGWTPMPTTTVVGGTRESPFHLDSVRTLMGFFSQKARDHRADFEHATVYLEIGEGEMW